MWGLITSLNDVLLPHLKSAFALDYVQATLIQLCFFGAYFVMSIPSGRLVEWRGYKQGMILGLLIAAIGAALFYPAAGSGAYPFFLSALFVLASGITLLQVAANPYVTVLGPASTASSRLTLTQAFNSLGTTVGPYLGALFILGATQLRGAASAQSVQGPYLVLAAALALIALVITLTPLPPMITDADGSAAAREPSVWSRRHLVLGALGIFAYVGGEVAIGSFMVNFLGEPRVASLPAEVAGKYLSLYWGGAMVGRFIGAALMVRLHPPRVLTFNALAVGLLLILAIGFPGHTAMWTMIAIGFFNSIMFPTIFALALTGLGARTGEGSGVLCMAIVGGAVVPELQGWLADSIGLTRSYLVPLACYAYVAYYGLRGYRPGSLGR